MEIKRLDLFIITGLILSITIVLALRLETVSQQNNVLETNQQATLENQRLIKEALNQSATNTELILQNQHELYNLINFSQNLAIQHNQFQENGALILEFLRDNFDESYLSKEYNQYAQSNNTQEQLQEIIEMLNGTIPINSRLS